ncbi:MAG TPA: hypothetical protein PL070_13355, partial [Flavobacteriales bacterium]|nr:hypothetical protein [Flavobacteriales bacterium]
PTRAARRQSSNVAPIAALPGSNDVLPSYRTDSHATSPKLQQEDHTKATENVIFGNTNLFSASLKKTTAMDTPNQVLDTVLNWYSVAFLLSLFYFMIWRMAASDIYNKPFLGGLVFSAISIP